ncbi:MAG: proline iminopeptidase-family hydrolase [Bacteroidetes bacterium]|nr:proline iminopeptidase-family hydrolase [Bacteroidota bacterium]
MIPVTCSVFLFACSIKTEPSEKNNISYYYDKDSIKSGGVKTLNLQTPKGSFKIWTKRIGNNPKIKVLLLNGGPGCTHEYFECFESFLPAEGIEFIYYDQLGCGNSDNPNDTALWDLARSVDEVEQIRTQLGLNNSNFYLLGHSWGGIVAMEYALKHQLNLKGLIISNMMCNAVEYGRYADSVLSKQMKTEVLKEIRQIEAKKYFSNPRYMELLMPNFYAEHICRLPLTQWPEPMSRSLNKINQSLYVTMQGPSEFGISGKLTNWNRKPDMQNIHVPTLIIGAAYDTMDPEHMRWMAQNVQQGTFLLCTHGSHMCMWDDQETYFKGLISFLKKGEE